MTIRKSKSSDRAPWVNEKALPFAGELLRQSLLSASVQDKPYRSAPGLRGWADSVSIMAAKKGWASILPAQLRFCRSVL